MTANAPLTPLFWEDGKTKDIHFGVSDLDPVAINDKGEILAIRHQAGLHSTYSAGSPSPIAYLLDPIRQHWNAINLLNFVRKPQEPWTERSFYLNNRGQILASYETLHSRHSFLWENGHVTPIGAQNLELRGEMFNDAGQVIGSYWPPHVCSAQRFGLYSWRPRGEPFGL